MDVTEVILMVIISLNLQSLAKYRYCYTVITIIFMAMAAFLGKDINGARSWVIIYIKNYLDKGGHFMEYCNMTFYNNNQTIII